MGIFSYVIFRKKIGEMKKYIKWFLVFAWMILIFLFSSESGIDSTETSQFFVEKVEPFFTHLIPGISFELITMIIRKMAHFFLYFVLGILVGSVTFANKKWCILSLLICLIYACTDEIHQVFVPGRSGQLKDVFIDLIGSSVGIYLYNWFRRKKIAQ